jgi:hypothetical protein
VEENQINSTYLRDILHYNEVTGIFTWITKRRGCKFLGMAGTLCQDGYIRIQIDKRPYKAHRLAWLWMTGEWPKGEIDHVHGNQSDNRWSELRDATHSINQQNQRRAKASNKCGLLGVSPTDRSRKNPWTARITIKNKSKHLGMFKTADEAYVAYLQAKRILHEGCTI